jgi:hypothetical protein
MPDERWGEAPHAFVVLKAGATATETELRNYARPSTKAASHFQTVTNSDLRDPIPSMSTSKNVAFVLRHSFVIRPSPFVLRHSSFGIRHSAFEECPSRQARGFEAVTGLTKQRSATAGEGAHGDGRKGWSHGKLGRTPASGWLHRLVRLFVIHAFNRRDCRLNGDWIKCE